MPTAVRSLTFLPDKEVKAAFDREPLTFYPRGSSPVEAIVSGWKRMASGELIAIVSNPVTLVSQLYCVDHLTRMPYPLHTTA